MNILRLVQRWKLNLKSIFLVLIKKKSVHIWNKSFTNNLINDPNKHLYGAFCENRNFKALKYFCQQALSQIFGRVLNRLLDTWTLIIYSENNRKNFVQLYLSLKKFKAFLKQFNFTFIFTDIGIYIDLNQ